MAHTTSCPACGTTFRITTEQLLARNGNVRCGRCAHVFNAHQSLALDYPQPVAEAIPQVEEPFREFMAEAAPETSVELQPAPEFMPAAEPEAASELEALPESAPMPEFAWETAPESESTAEPPLASEFMPVAEPEAPSELAAPPESPPMPEFAWEAAPEPESTAEPLLAPEFIPAAEPEALPEPAPITEFVRESEPESLARLDLEPEPEPLSEPSPAAEFVWDSAPEPPGEAAIESVSQPEVDAVPDVARAPEPSVDAPPPKRNSRRLWAAGATLMLFVLLMQDAMYFRTELIALSPGLKPAFEQACGVFGCRVALPQNADLLSIEASSLEADPANASIVVLNAALRNRASYPQAHPLFELTLTDYRDKLVARRVFQPHEYLPPGAATPAGMPANEEVEVKLNIDLGDVKAAGYRVYLFYPSTAS